jgi:hypothetical protein
MNKSSITGLEIIIALLTITFVTGSTSASPEYDPETVIVATDYIPVDIVSGMGFTGMYDAGYTGDGVDIAILDTGINGNHDDLRHGIGSTSSRIVVNKTFVPGNDTMDHDGHGTFITGILVGNGDSSGGNITGLVPDANIWNVKVLDDNGEGDDSWTENALDWIISLDEKPDIISISFGSPDPLPGIETRLAELWLDGITIIVAAGNDGPDYYTVDSPGSVLDVITVGACTVDEYLLSFSSEGPAGNYFYKPDVVAYGAEIVSLDLYSGYVEGHGTSFAVPFITAGAALLIEATGGLATPDEIKAALVLSSHSIGYSFFMEGAGLPDISMALEFLENASWNGVAVLPSSIQFPIKSKDGTVVDDELKDLEIKPTVILSRYDGDVFIGIDGDVKDAISTSIDEYDGPGDRQFVIVIGIILATPAFKSGSATIHIMNGDGIDLATISIIVESQFPYFIPALILGFIIAIIAGIIALFAVAYNKGSRAMPYLERCEIDGTCPVR